MGTGAFVWVGCDANGQNVRVSSEWKKVENGVMREIVRRKWEQSEMARQTLKERGEKIFCGHTACKMGKGNGENRLGKMWKEVREEALKCLLQPRGRVKSTPRAVPHKSCSPANPSWLGDFEDIRSSLEILAV